MRINRAFTLVEILVVIATIAVLTAILFPVFSRAIRSSMLTRDMEHMRQYATAYRLYAENGGGAGSTADLVSSMHLSQSMVDSNLDPIPMGALNAAYIGAQGNLTGFLPTYRCSVIGAGDLNRIHQDPQFRPDHMPPGLSGASNLGLAVSPAASIPFGTPSPVKMENLDGTYLRLLWDGHVIKRDIRQDVDRFPYTEEVNGKQVTCDRDILLFLDIDEASFLTYCKADIAYKTNSFGVLKKPRLGHSDVADHN